MAAQPDPDPDYILGQWWLDDQGHLIIQPRPESGKPSLVAPGGLLTATILDKMPKGEDGFLHPELVKVIGLKPIVREERGFRGGQYYQIGTTVSEGP
jgi:hypothetical protein